MASYDEHYVTSPTWSQYIPAQANAVSYLLYVDDFVGVNWMIASVMGDPSHDGFPLRKTDDKFRIFVDAGDILFFKLNPSGGYTQNPRVKVRIQPQSYTLPAGGGINAIEAVGVESSPELQAVVDEAVEKAIVETTVSTVEKTVEKTIKSTVDKAVEHAVDQAMSVSTAN